MFTIMPEVQHSYKSLCIEEVIEAFENNEPITGFVERINANAQVVNVRLGVGVLAYMPFSEVTLYPLRYNKSFSSTIPTNAAQLLNKKIRIRVTSIVDDYITVSRKQNMQLAFQTLVEKQTATMHITEIIEKSVFGDIGDGINGKIYISEVCQTHIKSASEILNLGDIINVVILKPDAQKRLSVSYRQTFPPYVKDDYPKGIIIKGKITDAIEKNNRKFYYVYISPQVSGILCLRNDELFRYGDKIQCTVVDTSDRGLYLKFCHFI